MEIESRHRIVLYCNNSDDFFEDITDPVYIYDIGDTFKVVNVLADPSLPLESKIKQYKVINVDHEIHSMMVGDQIINVTVEEVKKTIIKMEDI